MPEADFHVNNRNQLQVANQGRKPGLQLERNGRTIPMQEWALEILAGMQSVCEILDEDRADKPYTKALQVQTSRVLDPGLTPSARMLEALKDHNSQSFDCLGLTKSLEHAACFNGKRVDEIFDRQFTDMAQQSLAKQAELEHKPQPDFDDFLKHYFAQQ